MRDRDDLPVYDDTPPVPAVGSPDQRIYRPAVDRPAPKVSRAIRMSYRAPTAILAWVGVLAAVVWLPLAVLAVFWIVAAYVRGYRGAVAAAVVLVVVAAAHFFSAHAVHPFF